MANRSTILTGSFCPIPGPRVSRRSGTPATSWPRTSVAVRLSLSQRIEVTDENGEPIMAVPFREVVEIED
jgi:hypothetical protein